MGEEEVTALADVRVCVPELKNICLDGNPLGRGVTKLINCLRSGPQLEMLTLEEVQLTEKEATELCTLAKERYLGHLESDYVSFSFVIYVVNARNTQEHPGNEKEPFLKGAVPPFLSIPKKTHFCKINLDEEWSSRDNNC